METIEWRDYPCSTRWRENFYDLFLVVLTQIASVTDGRMDGQRELRLQTASRGNEVRFCQFAM